MGGLQRDREKGRPKQRQTKLEEMSLTADISLHHIEQKKMFVFFPINKANIP